MSKQWPDKFIIGLTGNIATGKSTVMRLAAEQGALTLDADKIVHHILENDPSMQAAIAIAFGPEVRRRDGAIDRAALAAIVFNDEEALRDLELMLHPAVRQEIVARIDASDASVVVLEAIKLLEGELVELLDQVWVTRAPQKVQIERLMVCRGIDAETAAMRVMAQNPQEAKVARADVVIDTDGTMAETRAQFELAWSRVEVGESSPAPSSRTPAMREIKTPPIPMATAQPAAAPPPEKAETVVPGEMPAAREEVMVRRARPSDIPAILLLIHRATDGRVKLKRADLLAAFSERSYLIGQTGTDISSVVGWNTDSTTAVCMDRFYIYPPAAAAVTGPPILAEIEKSARQLICEVALAFIPQEAPAELRRLLEKSGYTMMDRAEMPRAWQRTVDEFRPPGTVILGKVLRDVRVA